MQNKTELYYAWIKADNAWHEELVKQFKGRAGYMRYAQAGKGKEGSILRLLHDTWVKAGQAYWEKE